MFPQFCGSGTRKRRVIATVPKVEFLQPNDIVHFQHRFEEAKLDGTDNYELVEEVASSTTPYASVVGDYDGMQFTNSSWIPINNSRSRDLPNKRTEFSTPIKEATAERADSATPPNPNTNENRSEEYKVQAAARPWTEPSLNDKGTKSNAVLTIANMTRPFPASVQHLVTPNSSSTAAQSHPQAQEKRRNVSLTPNPRVNERFPNSRQKHLQTLSPNVKPNQAVPNSGTRELQEQQKDERSMSLSPNLNPQAVGPNHRQRAIPDKYNMRTFSLTPNPARVSNQKSHHRVASYDRNMQASPTTQPIRQNPIQNQEMNRFRVGNNRFPSSTTGWPIDLEALDAELGAVPQTPALMRKLQLGELLIRPIVTMRGNAYDEQRWFERDFDTERNFHASCTDFIQIVMLTDAQETAKKLQEFLTSDLIEPRYVPSEHMFQKRRLNHFHTFWNVMHQLPFYMKKWDKKTKTQLIWFYDVGVRDTLPCPFCQKHYIKWLKDKPVSGFVGSIKKLNQWLFKLHDEVNRTSKKPNFQWKEYERRWAPRKNTRKAVPNFSETKQDDVVLNIQKPFPMQRDVYTAPITYHNYQMYPNVGQQGQQVIYDTGFPTYYG